MHANVLVHVHQQARSNMQASDVPTCMPRCMPTRRRADLPVTDFVGAEVKARRIVVIPAFVQKSQFYFRVYGQCPVCVGVCVCVRGRVRARVSKRV